MTYAQLEGEGLEAGPVLEGFSRPPLRVYRVTSVVPRVRLVGIARPLLEQVSGLQAERDFYLVHCPERVMPGRLLHNLTTLDRVVGGVSPAGTAAAILFYGHVVRGRLDASDALTASWSRRPRTPTAMYRSRSPTSSRSSARASAPTCGRCASW